MRQFQTIDVTNTIGQWVDAFNHNALAASDHTWYLGEMLYNGILYTGLETIGGVKIQSLTNTAISHMSPQNIELDNFYLYFRDINKVLLVDQVTFDLRPYCDGQPHFFYINSELGFRVSQEFKIETNEVMLFRFILNQNEVFTQCYITAQRFGSNVYDTADEFYLVKGCVPIPVKKLQLRLGDGTIKRSGIRFDNHQMPDLLEIEDKEVPFNLRYIEADNTVDFTKAVTRDAIPNKKLDYKTKTLTNVSTGKFTIQRILYDVYTDCLIMQYGDAEYNDMNSALTSFNNVSYPFPYDNLMFIPMGLMIIKQGCTDLGDIEQCMLVQQLNITINPTDSVFFAEDSYARGRLQVLKNEIDDLQKQIDAANARMDKMDTRMDNMDTRMSNMDTRMDGIDKTIDNHKKDYNNPHKVTKAQLGLGNTENYSRSDLENYFNGKYVRLTTDQTVYGNKTFNDQLATNQAYIKVNGRKVFIGGSPSGQSVGDFWLPDA